MLDPVEGRAGLSAAEEARKAAQRALREQQARQAAVPARDAIEPSRTRGLFGASGATAPAAQGPTFSPSEAVSLAAGDRWYLEKTAPSSPPPQVPVRVRPEAGRAALIDNWWREGKAEIGVGDPALYDRYMAANRQALVEMADIVEGPQTSLPDMLMSGDLSQHRNDLVAPALAYLHGQKPGASFRLLGVEEGSAGIDPYGSSNAPLVIEMTQGAAIQQFVINPDRSLDGAQYRLADALRSDPALLQQWYQAAQPSLQTAGADLVPGDAEHALDYATFGTANRFDLVAQAVKAMPAEAQAELSQAFAATFLRPIDIVPADKVVLSLDANPIARGEKPGSLASTVHLDAVDGLASSTALPPIAGVSQQDWRRTLDALAANPPRTIEALESELIRFGGGITPGEINALKARDPNALPAVLNLVSPYPDLSFSQDLKLQLSVGGPGRPGNFYSMSYDASAGVVVVDTSLDRLLGNQADLDATYAVSDVPMTIRIPVPATAASVDWTNPGQGQVDLLNQRVETIGTVSLLLHGYQSTRGVWDEDMQRWMDLSPGDVIGISMAGMGSEGHFLGSGDSPFTPKQYAFDTMAVLDRLGLYGKELNVIGHSMGGAAALQIGLATDRLAATGVRPPDVRYVLLEPAPSGDSVPFLTSYPLKSSLISVQNWAGSQPGGINLDGLAYNVDDIPIPLLAPQGTGRAVVDALMPGAPEYIRSIHAQFADRAGFEQLKATAAGLTGQAEPDPQAIQAFLARHPVLVVAGTQDLIVAAPVVKDIFGDDNVLEVQGNHYAHLPSTIPEQDDHARVEEEVARLLNRPFGLAPGRGGGGGARVR